MLNIMDSPLPTDGVRTVYFTGDKDNSRNDYITVKPYGQPAVRLVVKDYTDWHLIEALIGSKKRLSVLRADEPRPFDEVIVEANIGRRHWTFAKNTQRGQSFIHCALPYGQGILLSL